MANFEDECVIYWNQRRYKRSASWYPKTNTGRFLLSAGAYQYHVFVAAIKSNLHHQESDWHFCYQVLHVDPSEKQYAEFPIALSNDRQKSNKENLTNLLEINLQKSPDPKHVIYSYQELLATENLQVEILIWHHGLGHLPFNKIKILALLGIIPKSPSNMNSPK